MIKLHGGPAEGSYATKRAPLFLRAVVNHAGHKDVLDLIDDTPADGELVSVYQRKGEAGTVHINRGSKGSGFYATGEYHYLPNVNGELFRNNSIWQEWVIVQADRLENGDNPVWPD